MHAYAEEGLKAGADKNRIAIGGFGTTDFLRVEYGNGVAQGPMARLCSSVIFQKPWNSGDPLGADIPTMRYETSDFAENQIRP